MKRPAIHRVILIAALLAATFATRAAWAAEIILYDGRNFGGEAVTLTQSTPDLGNFDNEASSVRVVSGTWILYRNANYGVTPSRPSLTLPPGNYPNLSDAGFPRNRLSSVGLVQDEPPPPPPTTQPPPPPPPAPAESDPRQPPGSLTPSSCTGPYHKLFRQNGQVVCKWTCGRNSSPDAARNRCSCNSGYVGRGTDRSGRVRCVAGSGTVAPPRPSPPAPTGPQRYTVDGAIAVGVANRNGFETQATSYFSNCTVAGHLVFTKRKSSFNLDAPNPQSRDCLVRFFQGRQLAPGWRMVDARVKHTSPRAADPVNRNGHCGRSTCNLSGLQDMPPVQVRIAKSVSLLSITLEGPAGRNWQDAFRR